MFRSFLQHCSGLADLTLTEDREEAGAPDPRTFFAAERTLLAWIRTGLALMGFGFVFARFGLFLRDLAAMRGEIAPRGGPGSQWLGIGLVVLGVLVIALAAIQHVRLLGRLRQGRTLTQGSSLLAIVLSIALVGLGLATAVYLVTLG